MNEILVIIPTFNEALTIERTIRDISRQGIALDILVVDDNSPDGTGSIVQGLQSEMPNLHLIRKQGDLGFGIGVKYEW